MLGHHVLTAAAVCLMTGGWLTAQAAATDPPAPTDLQTAVQQKIINLPYYGVFDNLGYQLNGTEVTLTGQVVNPALSDQAADAVKAVAGVTAVKNDIEILPPSTMDAQIRRAVFRAIYNDPTMTRYAVMPIPPIHIIVKNGDVTLLGAVGDETDKQIADVRAKAVPGTFTVTDNLQIVPGI